LANIALFTVGNSKHIASIKALFESFNQFNIKVDKYLIVSDISSLYDELNPKLIKELKLLKAQALRLIDVCLDISKVAGAALIYDARGFNDFLKYCGFNYLLNQYLYVCYIDVFSYLIQDITAFFNRFKGHDVAVIPNSLKESQNCLFDLTAGLYNSKFLGFNNAANEALLYMTEKSFFDFIDDKQHQIYYDQRWLDFLPSISDLYVIKEPNFFLDINFNSNDSYLKQLQNKDIYVINYRSALGKSNFKPNYLPQSVQKCINYQVDDKPFSLEDIENLCGIYKTELFSNFYRYHLLNEKKSNIANVPNPLILEEKEYFFQWVAQKDPELNLTRFLAYVYKTRGDLQQAFPEVKDGINDAFLNWVTSYGIKEGIPRALANNNFLEMTSFIQAPLSNSHRTLMRAIKRDDFKKPSLPGINVFGYVKSVLGLGEEARTTISSLCKAGIPFQVFNIYHDHLIQSEEPPSWGSQQIYNVNYFHINADQLPIIFKDLGSYIGVNRYNIGVWAWETQFFPEKYLKSLSYLDELWTVSQFTKQALEKFVGIPTYVRPIFVRHAKSAVMFDKAKYGLENKFLYLFTFDFNSVFERKNPLDLVKAFKIAFPNLEGAALIIKSVNGSKHAEKKALLINEINNRDDIVFIDEPFSQAQIDALMEAADVYVSFHRSEGFGMSLAESMLLGKAVIATAYSGNMDFMDTQNSLLIPYDLVVAGETYGPYQKGTVWAQPDVEKGAQLMRLLYDNRDIASELGQKARQSIINKMKLKSRASFIKERFDAIEAFLLGQDNNARKKG
jgi:glycosyltransferase involved in cell wall biosynthesis